ncbi:conserved membrane hypothetical protein [Verrucomicrobia bacterium]|nr:conserved membrane hypothetical protein [Verrucomicrobiota bacterium]
MRPPVDITWAHWVGFIACVLVFLALDLGLFHRRAKVVTLAEALVWTGVWICFALIFTMAMKNWRGPKEALQFLTGYLIEVSLSLDNLFVIAVVFSWFSIAPRYQHRVLFWGILGALLMRGLLIGAGVALVSRLDWVLYLLGLLLLFSGIRILFVRTKIEPEKNLVIRLVRRLFPVAPQMEGQRFLTRWQGRLALTPMALVLLMVETTDLLFATDSIPAVFAVTTDPFIVFTSNIFAILGLRSLYFVLAGAIRSFRYLKVGLSIVLVFFGVKMLLDPHGRPARWFQVEIPISISLLVVGGILLISIVLSLAAPKRDEQSQSAEPALKKEARRDG